jgi:hypothetical protein
MFDVSAHTYKKIISSIAVIGYDEIDIMKRGLDVYDNLRLQCLFVQPKSEQSSYNSLIFDVSATTTTTYNCVLYI